MPCFGNSPNDGVTAQRPQIPRPPQTESMSTPRWRAASRIVPPGWTRPRRPDGVKMTCGRGPASTSLVIGSDRDDRGGATPVRPPTAGLALRRRDAELADPAGRVGVVAHEDIAGHDGV